MEYSRMMTFATVLGARSSFAFQRKRQLAPAFPLNLGASCRVPDEYLLHNGSSLLAGREVLLGVLNDLRAEESA